MISSGERHRIERLLAVARVFLAVGVALLLYLDQLFHPGSLSRGNAGGVLLLVVYSALVFTLLARREASATFRVAVHLGDLCWPVALAVLAPKQSFWVLWFFAINAAAYRWGSWQTLATTGFALFLVIVEATLGQLVTTPHAESSMGPIDLPDLALRASYLLLFGVPVAYLAGRARQRRVDRQAIARLTRTPSLKLGMARTVQEILDQLRSLLGARDVLIAVNEIPAGRSYLWQARTADRSHEPAACVRELELSEEQCYWFAARARCWDMVRSRASGQRILALDHPQGRRTSPLPEPDMTSFMARHPCERLIVIGFALEKEWTGRIFVLDPTPVRDRKGRLKFLDAAVRELSPALYNSYLLRRVRSRSRVLERARVARELHDGVTQSLIGAQMKLEIARRNMVAAPAQVLDDLESVQRILQQEVSDLRDFMQRLKTADVGSAELLNVMTDCVDQLVHETGVAARLVTFDVDSILLSRRTCTELARILREALSNVRRHSGAQHVFVWFGAEGNRYALIVEDDGCGIASAPPSADDSWRLCAQPPSIAESVRAVGGTLMAYSALGKGLRLEISVPSAEARASSTESPRPSLTGSRPLGKLAMAKARVAGSSQPFGLAGGATPR